MIVLIGGEKGGTGKSTLATNLCVKLALSGIDVLLLDADPQATATKWIERRNENEILPVINSAQKTGDIYKTAINLASRYTHIIIDAGGRDSKELRTGIVAADKMYIPIRASQADLETLPHVDEMINLAKSLNPDLQVFAVLSMAPSNTKNKEIPEAREALKTFDHIGLSECIVMDRKIYRDAMLDGKGVNETNNEKAILEMNAFFKEIFDGV